MTLTCVWTLINYNHLNSLQSLFRKEQLHIKINAIKISLKCKFSDYLCSINQKLSFCTSYVQEVNITIIFGISNHEYLNEQKSYSLSLNANFSRKENDKRLYSYLYVHKTNLIITFRHVGFSCCVKAHAISNKAAVCLSTWIKFAGNLHVKDVEGYFLLLLCLKW